MAIKRTFRLSEDNADKLRRLSEERGVTATEIVNEAIRTYGTGQDASHTVSEGSHTGDDGIGNVSDDGGCKARFTTTGDSREYDRLFDSLTETIGALREQLLVKDQQIAEAMTALRSAQDTAKAAQALQAHTQQMGLVKAGSESPSGAVGESERAPETVKGSRIKRALEELFR